MQINSVTNSPTTPAQLLPQPPAPPADQSQVNSQTQAQDGGVKGHHHRGHGHHHHKGADAAGTKPASQPQDQVTISDAAKELNDQMTEQQPE